MLRELNVHYQLVETKSLIILNRLLLNISFFSQNGQLT